jgi:hypothetical protein
MPNSHCLRLVRLTAAAAVVTALSACATTGGRRGAERPADTAFVVSSPGWLNGTFEGSKTPSPDAASPRPRTDNPAIAAKSPWIGTIGIRQLLTVDWEVGLGVAVPNSYGPQAETLAPAPTDRFRGAAVGVWLKFDF